MRTSLTMAVLLAALACAAPSPCAADDSPPIRPRKLLIEDGELLKYGNYVGGERYQDISIVVNDMGDSDRLGIHAIGHQQIVLLDVEVLE